MNLLTTCTTVNLSWDVRYLALLQLFMFTICINTIKNSVNSLIMFVCVYLDSDILLFYENGSNTHQVSPDNCNLGTVTYGDSVSFIYDIIHHYVTSIRSHCFGGQMEKRRRENEREREFHWERDRDREGKEKERQRYLADTYQLLEIIWLISNSIICFKFD